MLKGLSDFVIALVELLEAEGRSAKRNVYAVVTAVGIFALGIMLLAGSVGFLVAGLYMGLATELHPAWVATICGIVLLLAGVIVLWIARDRAN